MTRDGHQLTTTAIKEGGAPNAVHPIVEVFVVEGEDWKDRTRSAGVRHQRRSGRSTSQRERRAFGSQTAWQVTWDWKSIDGFALRVKIQRRMVITIFSMRLCNFTTVQGKTFLSWRR